MPLECFNASIIIVFILIFHSIPPFQYIRPTLSVMFLVMKYISTPPAYGAYIIRA